MKGAPAPDSMLVDAWGSSRPPNKRGEQQLDTFGRQVVFDLARATNLCLPSVGDAPTLFYWVILSVPIYIALTYIRVN